MNSDAGIATNAKNNKERIIMRFPIDNLFDEMFSDFDNDFFDDPFDGPHGGRGLMRLPKHEAGLMRTDVKETKKNYKLAVELPGFNKEDIKVKLDNGFHTISAEHNEEKKDEEDGKIIRHERHFGSMSRSWYVGDELKQEDVKANYKDGILSLTVPKTEPKKELPENQKDIAIEG